jgi:hypothetical protein
MTMLQEIIVLTVAYIVLIGLFQPKKKTVAPIADPAASIDYFPEPPVDLPAELERDLCPKPVEPVAPAHAKATLASLIKEEVAKPAILAPTALCPVSVATAKPDPIQGFTPDLSKMGVRDLYRLAQGKVKGYKKLSKDQLIAALS